MLTVHHLNDSRSQRILWLLEELEVPYEIKNYHRLPSMQAPSELLAVNPLGKAPVITDGEINIAESGAIIEYILRKHGQGKITPSAEGSQSAVDDLYFLHYAEGTLMPILVQKLIFSLVPARSPWVIRWFLKVVFNELSRQIVEPELKKNIDMIESHLAKKDWLAGSSGPTAADYSMCMCLEILEQEKVAGPAMIAYVKRMQARPAYRRALMKGGEYAYGPKL
ncbi:thioredoxin-like protein [Lentinula aciculospora]|uniref:glutathione transferase n=1 Tax=Lentinula aciculospora TaxID=153920 RepID=A0A9W8ZWK8_9AGAR|nr:thioredoxin-like protein [Lentinula aciculospora]